jgi:HemY protein
MPRALLVLITAAIVVAIAWYLAGLPGEVTATIGGVTVEASTPVAALALFALFVVLFVVLRSLGALLSLPRTVRRRREARRRRHGDQAVTRTLIALAAGDQGDARREAARARRFLGDTPQTLLLAAEAGRLAGREGEAESAFRSLAGHSEAAFLGLRGLLRQAMARQDWAEAAILAREAEAVHPGAAWLRSERAELAIRTGAWSEALALADADAPKAGLATAAAEAESDTAQALRLAKQAWEEDPTMVPAALAYARRLRENGREGRARDVIRRCWAANPHPDLAEFALAPITDPLARMQEAKRLAQENPSHPESHIMLARAALAASLPGEARHQVEAARATGLNQRRLWLLLADIEEADRPDTDAGRIAQRDALRHAANADPDPVWRCNACGTTHQRWLPACPNCGTAGQTVWAAATPERSLTRQGTSF